MAFALCGVMALPLCVDVEAVIVALVLLLGALLCATWPSATVAANGSRALRPAAIIDGKPATSSATHEPPRELRVGDSVFRRGELCTVVAIDRSVVPFGVAVQHEGTGAVAHTELAFLALPAECTPRPAPRPLPPPRLPLLRLLVSPVHIAAVPAMAILARVVIGPFRLLRLTELIRLIRQLGRSYRSDEAGDGPATQGPCQGRDGKECRHPRRPVPTVANGINRRTRQKEYRSWCQACHDAKPDWSGWYPSPTHPRQTEPLDDSVGRSIASCSAGGSHPYPTFGICRVPDGAAEHAAHRACDSEESWGADTRQGIGQMELDGEGLTPVSTWNLPSVCVSVWLASHRRTLCRTLGNGDSFFLAVGCAVGYLSAVQALWPDAAASAWVGRLRSMAVDFVLHNLQWSLNATAGDALHSLRDLGVWI